MEETKDITLEDGVSLLQQEAKLGPITIEKILHILSGKGRALILLMLSLPFCLPIQIPGFSTPFGLAIAFIGIRLAFGKHAWLPQKLLSKQISSETLETITSTTLKFIRKIKRLVHPRLNWMCHSLFMQIFNGLFISLLGLFLAIPLPIPFTNLAAAIPIFFISLGMLEDDGLFVLLGYLIVILSVILFIFLAFSLIKLF